MKYADENSSLSDAVDDSVFADIVEEHMRRIRMEVAAMTPEEREERQKQLKRDTDAYTEKEIAERNRADAARVADALSRSDDGLEMAIWVIVVFVCSLLGLIAVLAYFK